MAERNDLDAYYNGNVRFENEEEVQHAHHFDEYPPYVEREVEIADNPNPNPNEQVQGTYFDDENPNEVEAVIEAVDFTFIYLDQLVDKAWNAGIIMVTEKLREVEIVIKRRRYDEDARRIVRIIKPNSLNIVRMRLLETTRAAFDEADYHVDVQVMQEISDAIQINNDEHFELDGHKIFHLGPACIAFDKRLTVFLPQKLQILCAHDTIRNNLHGISVDDFCNLIHVCIGCLSPNALPLPEALVVLKLYRRYADDMTEMHEGELRQYDYNYFPNLAMRDFGRIHTKFPQHPKLVKIPRHTFTIPLDIRQPFEHVIRDIEFVRKAHIALYDIGSGFVSFALWVEHTIQDYRERQPFEMPLTVKVTVEINGVKLKRQPTISRKLRKNYRSMGCPNLFSLHDLMKLADHSSNNQVRLIVEVGYEQNESAFDRNVEDDFKELKELGFFTNPDAMPANRLNSPETRKLLDILIHGTIQMDNAEFRLILELAQLIGCERAKEYCCRAFTTVYRIVANRANLGGLFQRLHPLLDGFNNQDYIKDHVRACEWAVQHATVDLYADHMYYDWTQSDLEFVWQGHHV